MLDSATPTLNAQRDGSNTCAGTEVMLAAAGRHTACGIAGLGQTSDPRRHHPLMAAHGAPKNPNPPNAPPHDRWSPSALTTTNQLDTRVAMTRSCTRRSSSAGRKHRWTSECSTLAISAASIAPCTCRWDKCQVVIGQVVVDPPSLTPAHSHSHGSLFLSPPFSLFDVTHTRPT